MLAVFANISDYAYGIEELRIDLFSEAGARNLYLAYMGMFANDCPFEWSPVGSGARITVVPAKAKDDWKITHGRLSSFPAWKASRPCR